MPNSLITLSSSLLIGAAIGGWVYLILIKWKGRKGNPLTLFAPLNARLPLESFKARYKEKRSLAGNQNFLTADAFLSVKESFAFIAFILFQGILGVGLEAGMGISVLAFFLPDIKLADEIKKRRMGLKRAFIPFLDLFVLVLESGMDFSRGAQFLVKKLPKNPVTGEIEKVLLETQVGSSRAAALAGFSRRIKTDEAGEFAAAVVQSEKTGASLAKTLRSLLLGIKTRRLQAAEKLGYEAPVKLLGPLVLFIFPVVFIVLFGPIVIGFLE